MFLGNPTLGAIESVYQAILTTGILEKFRQQVILMEDLLNNDETTLILIRDSILYLYDPCTRPQGLPDHLQTHILFKDIVHELLNTTKVMPNLALSFGTTSLEELLVQRLKRLL